MLGYYSAGDKPELLYEWKTGLGEDDGGSVINSTGGRWEAIFLGKINVLDYGLRSGEEEYDVNTISKILREGAEVHFNKGVYKIGGTYQIPSNVKIIGNNTRILVERFKDIDAYYNETLFEIVNKNNVVLYDITIDFDRQHKGRDSYSGAKMNAGIKMSGSKNIMLEKCNIINFSTNEDTSKTQKEKYLDFCCISIDKCSEVYFINTKVSSILEEFLICLDTTNIVVDNYIGDMGSINDLGSGSTHLSFFYCTNVDIKNSEFRGNAGSVINIYSNNVNIENITVNKGLPRRGRGIDIGDELYIGTTGIKNITIRNCYLNVFSYGVATSMGGEELYDITNVKIENNYFDINEQLTGGLLNYNRCIIVSNPVNWEINNNTVIQQVYSNEGSSIFVHLNPTKSTRCSLNVENNKVESNTFFRILSNTNGDYNYDSLNIKGNTFKHIKREGNSNNLLGFGSFIFARKMTNTTSDVNIKSLNIERNNVRNLVNGFFFFEDSSTSGGFIFDTINIENNNVESLERYIDNNKIISKEANRSKSVNIVNNYFNNIRAIRIDNFESVTMEGNYLEYNDGNWTVVQIQLYDILVKSRVSNNYFKNTMTAYNNVEFRGSVTPKQILSYNNITTTTVGVNFYKQNLKNTEDLFTGVIGYTVNFGSNYSQNTSFGEASLLKKGNEVAIKVFANKTTSVEVGDTLLTLQPELRPKSPEFLIGHGGNGAMVVWLMIEPTTGAVKVQEFSTEGGATTMNAIVISSRYIIRE